jgi:hypothetical protein
VDARQRRAEIQTHLSDARALADAGERDAALEKVAAALALDGGNVAAQTLREEISSFAPVLSTQPTGEAGQPRPNLEPIRENIRPLVSAEGLAQFEERARQRRIERRLAAARAEIGGRRFIEARAALAEVRELDAARPELTALTLDLEAAERTRATRAMRATAGPLAAAAATFAGITLSASLIGNTGLLQSYPMTDIAALAPGTETASLSAEFVPGMPMATTGDQLFALSAAPVVDEPRVRNVAEIALDRPVAEFVEPPPAFVAAAPAPGSAPVPLTAAVVPAAAVVSAPALVPPPAPPAAADIEADDARGVRAALQRYQTAYDRLDARLAQAVWPGVNQVALARAFDGLESQTLTFNDCDVRLLGSTARARCTGSTRYVPKVGSGAPRVEPLVWNFTLRRDTDDWQIETARADR